jgi:hypothetical protein
MLKSEIPADMSFKTVSRDFSISTSVNAISRFACASWHIFIWKQDIRYALRIILFFSASSRKYDSRGFSFS